MAIDTRDKRASAAGFALLFLLQPPLADGALDQGDRQQAANAYRGVSAGEAVEPPAATALTGRKVPFRSYRRGRLIDDSAYWQQESQDIGETEKEVVESAIVRSTPLTQLAKPQLRAMQQAITEARTEKIRKKRVKDLALFEQKLAEEQEEQEVLDLLLELMQ